MDHSSGRGAPKQEGARAARARRARDYILEHSAAAIDITMLAQALGISIRTLQDDFHHEFGMSPREFILQSRLERARALLLDPNNTMSVTTIALAAGFRDLSHFAAKYQRKYGELPSATLRRPKE